MSGTVANQNTSIAVNELFDIYLDINGNLAIVTGVDACEQDCQSIMQTMLREMPLDYANGVPYFDTVFRQLNLNGFTSASRQQLLNVPGVTSVASFSASVSNNVLTYNAQIVTVYSPNAITITGSVAITN